jgi:hypothetical protein
MTIAVGLILDALPSPSEHYPETMPEPPYYPDMMPDTMPEPHGSPLSPVGTMLLAQLVAQLPMLLATHQVDIRIRAIATLAAAASAADQHDGMSCSTDPHRLYVHPTGFDALASVNAAQSYVSIDID